MGKTYSVYILASHKRTLYVGVTSDLWRRLAQHRQGDERAFTHRYQTRRLVHCESYDLVGDALRREKQLKGWTRAKKVALIESVNRDWRDLADGMAL
jgi:putative endonuclease